MIVYLYQTSSSRTRLWMLQKRRDCLYALTCSTSLTLVFTTSKKVFNPLLQRSLWWYLFIFFVNAFWSCNLYFVRWRSFIAVFSVSWSVVFDHFMWRDRRFRVSSDSYMKFKLYKVRIQDQSISIVLSFLSDNQCEICLISHVS